MEGARVVHAIPGRMRVHLPGWSGQRRRGIEVRLCGIRGVFSAQANPLTGNVLVRYAPAVTDSEAILRAAGTRESNVLDGAGSEADLQPRPLVLPLQRTSESVRIQVSDPDRHTSPAHRIVACLLQTFSGSLASTLGLGLLAIRRLLDLQSLSLRTNAAMIAELVGIVERFPVVRTSLRVLLGPRLATLMSVSVGIAGLVLVGGHLDLSTNGVEALQAVVSTIGLLELAPIFRTGLSLLVGPGVTELVFIAAALTGLFLVYRSQKSGA